MIPIIIGTVATISTVGYAIHKTAQENERRQREEAEWQRENERRQREKKKEELLLVE